VVGYLSTRLRRDIAERRRAERDLSLYADQLERANQELAQSVERLEAFAEIVRTVGGETDLERVLTLIQSQGREIVSAQRLVVFLPEGEELVAVTRDSLPRAIGVRLPVLESRAGEVLITGQPRLLTAEEDGAELDRLMPGATTAILVPLVFRGGILGVLAGIDRLDGQSFAEEDEQLLESVAASAATAVATARSVAAERLRLSLDAAEQARARWARELHDQTLQGLTGARMMLAAGLAREDLEALRRAAEAADAHLAAEVSSLRDLITELRPTALDDLGLGPAVESLAKRQAAAGGFELEMSIELAHRARPRELESASYRIIQEALSNVVRHGHATRVELELRQLDDRVRICVRDDGAGFVLGTGGEGFGLTGMRERAVLLGGELSVRSARGGPTSVTAELPLPH
jgi:signal transduction histidine kinase